MRLEVCEYLLLDSFEIVLEGCGNRGERCSDQLTRSSSLWLPRQRAMLSGLVLSSCAVLNVEWMITAVCTRRPSLRQKTVARCNLITADQA